MADWGRRQIVDGRCTRMRSLGSSPKRSRTWSGRRKRVGASGCADVGASTGCWEVIDVAEVVADKQFVLECSKGRVQKKTVKKRSG